MISHVARTRLKDDDYRRLLEFRVALRQFLKWSEEQASAAGITTQQHQLLLAVRGHPGLADPTVGEIADHLLLRHHSTVELIDRTAQAGYVTRAVDGGDRRIARVHLTAAGRTVLHDLSAAHLEELARLAPTVGRLSRGLQPDVA